LQLPLITSQSSLQQSRSPPQLAPRAPHDLPPDDEPPEEDPPLDEPPDDDPPLDDPPLDEPLLDPELVHTSQYESQFFGSLSHLESSGLQHALPLCVPAVHEQLPFMQRDAWWQSLLELELLLPPLDPPPVREPLLPVLVPPLLDVGPLVLPELPPPSPPPPHAKSPTTSTATAKLERIEASGIRHRRSRRASLGGRSSAAARAGIENGLKRPAAANRP